MSAVIIQFADLKAQREAALEEQNAIGNMSIDQMAESLKRIFEETVTQGKYQIGQKIYNKGDQANRPEWLVITSYNARLKSYDMKQVGGDQTVKGIYEGSIYEVDSGNYSTRFITEKAFNDYRNKQFEQLQQFINKTVKAIDPEPEIIEKTETTLKNDKCIVELDSDKKVSGRDLTDRYNEPAFYNKTSRGLQKAWKALQDSFSSDTTMHDVMKILEQYKIRTHSYCMMD